MRPTPSTLRLASGSRGAGLRTGLLAAVLGWALGGAAQPGEMALRRALDAIDDHDLRRHVEVLADDALEGRQAGSRGGRAAGTYLGRELARLGLAGGADGGGYYQPFDGGCRNVLGLIPGSDPALAGQVLVVGAHYDHVGYGSKQNSYGPLGRIHNGADDNASGAAALLELVDACLRLDPPPPRSVLFAFWDSEENGLVGSKHWTDHPTVPLERIALVLNVDMIGRLRGDRLEVYGSRTAPGLRRLLSHPNQAHGLLLDFSWAMKQDSDHYTFFARGIPALMLHTGLHEDYHRPSDDAERLNVDGMRRVTEYVLALAAELAAAPSLPGFRAASRIETPAVQRAVEQSTPSLPPRLGVSWQADNPASQGVRLVRVTPGSPGGHAGLKPGDRIVRAANQDLRDGEHLRQIVLAAGSPLTLVVAPEGDGPRTELTIPLEGRRLRLGITWRVDDAEPGAVILTQVLPGSPAEHAGLRPGDRVYQVTGREFFSGDEFRAAVLAAGNPLKLSVERNGQMHSLAVIMPTEGPGSPED